MKTTCLAKITQADYGVGGYNEAMLGMTFTLEGKGWGISDHWGFWYSEPSVNAKWDEQDQIRCHGEVAARIGRLLRAAGKSKIQDLVGVPVEVKLEDNALVSWRILDEVL